MAIGEVVKGREMDIHLAAKPRSARAPFGPSPAMGAVDTKTRLAHLVALAASLDRDQTPARSLVMEATFVSAACIRAPFRVGYAEILRRSQG